MSEASYVPQMIRVLSDSRTALAEVADHFDSELIKVGQVREVSPVTDLHMHPMEIARSAYELMIVITKIGGAVQFANWIFTIMKRKNPATKASLTIQIGDENIELSTNADPGSIKLLVESKLKANGQPDAPKSE